MPSSIRRGRNRNRRRPFHFPWRAPSFLERDDGSRPLGGDVMLRASPGAPHTSRRRSQCFRSVVNLLWFRLPRHDARMRRCPRQRMRQCRGGGTVPPIIFDPFRSRRAPASPIKFILSNNFLERFSIGRSHFETRAKPRPDPKDAPTHRSDRWKAHMWNRFEQRRRRSNGRSTRHGPC
jgi:hypothetical protein